MIKRVVPAVLVILLATAIAGWVTQGTTVAFVLSLAGVPGCF